MKYRFICNRIKSYIENYFYRMISKPIEIIATNLGAKISSLSEIKNPETKKLII